MPSPLNVKNIAQCTNVGNSNANSNWTYFPVRAAQQETSNPQFPRGVVLTSQGVLITRNGVSFGYPLETLCIGAALTVPALTWLPNYAAPNGVQPVNFVQNDNTAASFTANAQDEVGAITYQWQWSNGVNIAAAGVYSNVTTNHLNISNINGLGGLLFQIVATNPTGSNTSNQAGMADIVTQPSNSSVASPSPTSFSVNVASALALSYQWAANHGGGFFNIVANGGMSVGSLNYSNWTTNTLNVGNSAGGNGYKYFCYVSVPGATANSNVATLTVT